MWIENKIYKIGETVVFNDEKFKCLQTHLSTNSFEPPNEPRLWTNNPIALEIPKIVYNWTSGTYYFQDDYVLFSNVLYVNRKHHISNPFISPANNKYVWEEVHNSPPKNT
jgi:hypothetical protein